MNSQKLMYTLTNREIRRKLELETSVENLNHFGGVGE